MMNDQEGRRAADDLHAAVDSLQRVVEKLETASRLLDEVYRIGVWSKSDDASDNRNRRRLLRETDWEVAGVYRAVATMHLDAPDLMAAVEALARDIHALDTTLELLPDTVSDTMGDTMALDVAVTQAGDDVKARRQRASQLSAECARRLELCGPAPEQRGE